MEIGVAFDFDGVLVNSYRDIEDFYYNDLPRIIDIDSRLIDYIIYMEYVAEAVGWLREDWWFKTIPSLTEESYDVLITRYWEKRIGSTILNPGIAEVLEYLRKQGIKLFSVSFRDEIYGLKRYRIELSGIDRYLDGILVVGEDVGSRSEGLSLLIEEYGLDKIIYVDDKPLNLYKIYLELGDKAMLIHYAFKGRYDFPWYNPGSLFRSINDFHELIGVVKDLLKE